MLLNGHMQLFSTYYTNVNSSHTHRFNKKNDPSIYLYAEKGFE